jgi:hypothetical protein
MYGNTPRICIPLITTHVTVVEYVTRKTKKNVTSINRWRPQRTDTLNMTRASVMPIETAGRAAKVATACLQLN